MNVLDGFCISIGGLGIIASKSGDGKTLYVDVKSKNNEIVFDDGTRWVGTSARVKQSVFVWGQKVFAMSDLPDEFSLADSVVISFEHQRILFYDARSNEGGYYERIGY